MDASDLPTYSFSWDASKTPIGYSDLWGEKGAFTTMRLDVRKDSRCAYFIENHIARLCETLTQMGINAPFEQAWIWRESLIFLAGVAKHGSYMFRIMATADCLAFKASPRIDPHFQITATLWEHKRNTPELKTLDYTDIINALDGVDRAQNELILHDEEDRLLEGATSNLIFIRGRSLYIPSTNNLRGLTLQHILPILADQYEIIEEDVTASSLSNVDEILCCGSGKGVVCITEIPELEWVADSVVVTKSMRNVYDRTLIQYRADWRGP